LKIYDSILFSYFTGNVSIQGANNFVYVYNSSLIARQVYPDPHITADNRSALNVTIGSPSADNNKVYLYNANLSATVDITGDSGVVDTNAKCITITKANNTVNAYNCTLATSLTGAGSGTATDAAVYVTAGEVNLYGGKVTSTTGYDIEQTGGLVSVYPDFIYDTTNTSGTVTQAGRVISEESTGSSTAANGTVEIVVNGTSYYILKSASAD
jgi:hypothetical protein